MIRWIYIGVLVFVHGFFRAEAQRPFRILEYNVENLFDLRHDDGHRDEEFLLEGEKCWNAYKYWKKQNLLAKVVAAVGEGHIPDLMVLCEVENDTVVRDLCRRSALRALGYRSLQTASEDDRGIDVAVLYQPGRFRDDDFDRYQDMGSESDFAEAGYTMKETSDDDDLSASDYEDDGDSGEDDFFGGEDD